MSIPPAFRRLLFASIVVPEFWRRPESTDENEIKNKEVRMSYVPNVHRSALNPKLLAELVLLKCFFQSSGFNNMETCIYNSQ